MGESLSHQPVSVPRTILQQLGGRLFCRVTGAKDLVYGDKTLTMSVSSRLTKSKVNRVRITLLPDDTYKIETLHYSGRLLSLTRIDVAQEVFVSDLRQSFTSLTGLDCTPPNIVLFPT